jgi:hypothetical protein
MSEKQFAKGMYAKVRTFNTGGEITQVTYKKRQFIEWLESIEEDENGYVRVDINKAKEPLKDPKNTHYVTLNTWKPEKKETQSDFGINKEKEGSDLPF